MSELSESLETLLVSENWRTGMEKPRICDVGETDIAGTRAGAGPAMTAVSREPGSKPSADPDLALRFPGSRTMRNEFLLFDQPSTF